MLVLKYSNSHFNQWHLYHCEHWQLAWSLFMAIIPAFHFQPCCFKMIDQNWSSFQKYVPSWRFSLLPSVELVYILLFFLKTKPIHSTCFFFFFKPSLFSSYSKSMLRLGGRSPALTNAGLPPPTSQWELCSLGLIQLGQMPAAVRIQQHRAGLGCGCWPPQLPLDEQPSQNFPKSYECELSSFVLLQGERATGYGVALLLSLFGGASEDPLLNLVSPLGCNGDSPPEEMERDSKRRRLVWRAPALGLPHFALICSQAMKCHTSEIAIFPLFFFYYHDKMYYLFLDKNSLMDCLVWVLFFF